MLLYQFLMLLRAYFDAALLMLIYARWPVKEDGTAELVMSEKSDNKYRAITPSSVKAYVTSARCTGVVAVRERSTKVNGLGRCHC